jgi:hypothetical protein
MFIVYPSPKFWKSGSKYLDPTNAAGRKNLEALSNGTFSDKLRRFSRLAVGVQRRNPAASIGANRLSDGFRFLPF